MSGRRFAVVGHAEWADFLVVSHVPKPGEIVNAGEHWAEAAGGGAVAAVQLAKLAGEASFFTALGADRLGRAAEADLRARGLALETAVRDLPQRRAVVFLDAGGERTITTLGTRLVPRRGDPLPWDDLARAAGVYFTGGDTGALTAARRARTLVVTPRARDALTGSGVEVDVLVRSASDAGERDEPEAVGYSARMIVTTEGARGGTYAVRHARSGRFVAAPLQGPLADAYGAGDSFAAGLTFALGSGYDIDEAVAIAARCGAGNLTGRGPYAGQPRAADLAVRPV